MEYLGLRRGSGLGKTEEGRMGICVTLKILIGIPKVFGFLTARVPTKTHKVICQTSNFNAFFPLRS